ncbi:bifunctional 2-polyprenyl-6-hydroxyphenol methylase/3-demethylubiquinol 3-O-methyltransferase UbiG [Jeotgalibacillus sp. R-1-5s-1]|uniref:class I SAM-dependent methyltransferase n=1 Tax=Jeotgalibacillus sp. R-1-5s-1 TaxID=2555897 RepID=UPI00106BC8A1|nr:methyltransferase domain-containing protein [Jeotgalibacillus sp. R-1-5s-1]TFD92445.1 class I SAM-dependent methyltransferase [Jeotgalibacillus sp. R-1-5s-1]
MNDQSAQNKKAWEYRAYEFWIRRDGLPENKAREILINPMLQLKKHKMYFADAAGKRVANLCGSNGRKAVPLALLGAEVTVFDQSEENKKYALELAEHANTSIEYIITDIYDIDLKKYTAYFDMLYLEGGILHYFHDIEKLMSKLFSLLNVGGSIVLSDYHPAGRCITRNLDNENNFHFSPFYFDEKIQHADISYKRFFDEEEQEFFPDVLIKQHTLSDIINALISSGFTLNKFDEHKGWGNENIPWEFTIIAGKEEMS